MNILYMSGHSILEHDELRLFHALGHDVFSLGSYITPSAPHDGKRPALPELPDHPELRQVVDAIDAPDRLDAAKVHLPDALLEWADVIVCAAFPDRWIVPEWDRLRGRRIIWRTIGQSVAGNERQMAPLFDDGLEIVRYSPRERNIPEYAGETALIRFAKDPEDWHGWTGEDERVVNFTQHLAQRDPYTNYGFWKQSTYDLPREAYGPGSEAIGGPGAVSYDEMREVLQGASAYLYTGTQPSSYTLGLIEALMTGTPTVSIGPSRMRIDYGHTSEEMFEGHELAGLWSDDPAKARLMLMDLLQSPVHAERVSQSQREKAIEMFGFEGRVREWGALLGSRVLVAA